MNAGCTSIEAEAEVCVLTPIALQFRDTSLLKQFTRQKGSGRVLNTELELAAG
jgi:hypothetical protein